MASPSFDAVVVGAGPNGLAAAITLARAGRSVVVLEANETVGGACRSTTTAEGVVHDLASSIHPLATASPFFREIRAELADHGLRWVDPPAAAAHPLDDGAAAIVWHDLDRTVDELGPDGDAYARVHRRWIDGVDDLIDLALRPLLRVPRRPLFAARFGALAAVPAATLARREWRTDAARALFAGHAAHSILPLEKPFTSTFGLLLGTLAHTSGWGFPEGGAQSLADAMARYFESLGGEIRLGSRVDRLDDLPPHRGAILTQHPHVAAEILGERAPERYRRDLRSFAVGPAAWKVDFVLDGPIPWANPAVAQAGTVHLGGTLEEIARSEREIAAGRADEWPFVLLAQHTMFDPTRAPEGRHAVWAYCHVPNGYDPAAADGTTLDPTATIVAQIERFAPGFRARIVTQQVTTPTDLATSNANLVGGDVGGGSYAGTQLFARPRPQLRPFDTPVAGVYLASASTSPGAGVHGMAGLGAAQRLLDA